MTSPARPDSAAVRTPPVDLLLLPAAEGAAAIARRLLARVAQERLRLDQPDDAEALHDFRVALRQLRSWLRAFRAQLGRAASRKIRRRLRGIARASNDSRDAQVQLEWLRAQDSALPADARPGLEWLIARVAARDQVASERFRERIIRDFDRTGSALDLALAGADATVQAGASVDEPPPVEGTPSAPRAAASRTCAAAVAKIVRRQAAEVGAHLRAVHDLGDDHEVHRARLAGKRLRYVLQPLAEETADVRPVIAHLKAIQDALGELHDAHVLIEAVADALGQVMSERSERLIAAVRSVGAGTDRFLDPSSAGVEGGLLAIAARLHERAARAFAEVRDSWLGARSEVLLAEISALAERLEVHAARGGDVEIERKYLLRELPAETLAARAVEIEQGYLPGARLTERLRHVRENGTERWLRTVKLGSGLVRTEVEEDATAEVVATMWPLTHGRRLRKRRYAVPDGPLTWQIDEFLDRKLVLAEVELPSADVVVELPMWLEPLVVREVTDESEYANVNLAR